MRRAVLLCLLAASGAAVSTASGQTFERFGVREGLPSELVNDVEIGPDGLLWVATDDGLARFDGHGFRVWRHRADDPASIPSSRVASVLPVDGAVWMGTADGVARLELETGRVETVGGLPDGTATALVEDADGRIWVGYSDRGLWRLSPETGRVRPIRFGTSQRYRVIALAADTSGVWVEALPRGAMPVVCRLDADRGSCADVRPAEPWRLFEDRGRPVLVYRDRETRWTDWPDTGERWPSAPTDAFRAVLRVGPDEAWFRASTITVLRADGSERTLRAAPQRRGELGGYDVRALTQDRQGSVWVGTEAGLYLARRPAPAFVAVRHDPADAFSLGDNRVNGMGQDEEGRLWIATNGGLFRLDLASGQVEAFPAERPGILEPSTARAFWQVLPRGGDRALVGLKRGGIGRWDGEQLRLLSDVLVSGVRDIAEGPDGDVWVTGAGALWRLRDGTVSREPLPLAPSLPVNVIETDREGRLWVGTDGGVWRRADGAWRPVAEGSLCAPIVWSMTETPADPGAMWVATVGGGLARIDADDRVTCVTDRDGLPTNSVYGVLADDAGRLWASTTSGLARVDPVTREVVTFSSADGLAGDAFNLMAQLRLRDGRLAFGGPDGLTIVDPEAVEAREPPSVVITGVERQGRLLRGLPEAGLELAHDAGAFGVRFAAVDFRAPRRNRYRYRLVGLDDDWQTTDGSAPRAAYVGVQPGRYRFEVRGAAADTPFSEAATFDVVVVPAVWQRLWFRLGAALLLVGAVTASGLGLWLRRRQADARERAEAVEIRRRLAEARERERVRLARDLHDGPVQTLYRVGHDLDRLGEGGDGVGPVRERVGDVAGELRQILTDLRPTLVDHLGLGAALRSAGRRAEERFPDLTVTVEDHAGGMASEAGRLALFRIAQEALQNAGRHAGPARVTIELEDMAEGVQLTVRDDGRGFDLPERMVSLARTEHFGLVGAQERAEAAGGTFEVRTRAGAGTAVLAWVPGPEPSGRRSPAARRLDP